MPTRRIKCNRKKSKCLYPIRAFSNRQISRNFPNPDGGAGDPLSEPVVSPTGLPPLPPEPPPLVNPDYPPVVFQPPKPNQFGQGIFFPPPDDWIAPPDTSIVLSKKKTYDEFIVDFTNITQIPHGFTELGEWSIINGDGLSCDEAPENQQITFKAALLWSEAVAGNKTVSITIADSATPSGLGLIIDGVLGTDQTLISGVVVKVNADDLLEFWDIATGTLLETGVTAIAAGDVIAVEVTNTDFETTINGNAELTFPRG
jgi:hypothetical protein